MVDLTELNQAYTRLSEKFKTLWTFHQFLQGVHKTFFGDAPSYRVDFQGQYDQVKSVAAAMTFQPPPTVMGMIVRFDGRLDTIQRTLAEDDLKISPNYVRRFFERVRTEDEKLLVSLLRFYFYTPFASHDTIDKMDFLITLVGARRAFDDGRYVARFPVELQKLFGGCLGLVRRNEPEPDLVKVLVERFAELRREIDGCDQFEDLTEKKVLERLRSLKHNLGTGFYSADVLSAMLETNLAAKNKFASLYESEERRIQESSRQLLDMEKELARNPRYRDEDIQVEFQRFHQFRRDFENKELGVRHQDVARLAESIESLLSRLDVPDASKSGAEPPRPPEPPAPAPAVAASSERSRSALAETGGHASAPAAPAASVADATPSPAVYRSPVSPAESDPLTSEQAMQILYSVGLLDDGADTPRSAPENATVARLRLEPWEVRAARRTLHQELSPDPAVRARDLLYFEGAAVRLRIDADAQSLRTQGDRDAGDRAALETRLSACGLCLIRAQDLDRRFRQEIDAVSRTSAAEKLNELNRSRFRLLRSFSGLWLLHNKMAKSTP